VDDITTLEEDDDDFIDVKDGTDNDDNP